MPQTIILIASSLVKAPPFEQYRVFFAIRMRSAGMLCGTIWDFVAASAAGRVAIIIFRTTPFIAAIFFLVGLMHAHLIKVMACNRITEQAWLIPSSSKKEPPQCVRQSFPALHSGT